METINVLLEDGSIAEVLPSVGQVPVQVAEGLDMEVHNLHIEQGVPLSDDNVQTIQSGKALERINSPETHTHCTVCDRVFDKKIGCCVPYTSSFSRYKIKARKGLPKAALHPITKRERFK